MIYNLYNNFKNERNLLYNFRPENYFRVRQTLKLVFRDEILQKIFIGRDTMYVYVTLFTYNEKTKYNL